MAKKTFSEDEAPEPTHEPAGQSVDQRLAVIEARLSALEAKLPDALPLPPIHVPEIGSVRDGVFLDGCCAGRKVADVEAEVASGSLELVRHGEHFRVHSDAKAEKPHRLPPFVKEPIVLS